MSLVRRLATQTCNHFKRYQHIIKPFEQLQKGDMVYNPSMIGYKDMKCRLIYPFTEYVRDYNSISEFSFFKCDVLDDNLKPTGQTTNIQTDGLGSYGSCTLLNRPSHIDFMPHKVDASGLRVDDIITKEEPYETNGYLQLEQFVKRDNIIHYVRARNGNRVEVKGLNYWLCLPYDTNLVALPAVKHKLYSYPLDEQESSELTFRVIENEELDKDNDK